MPSINKAGIEEKKEKTPWYMTVLGIILVFVGVGPVITQIIKSDTGNLDMNLYSFLLFFTPTVFGAVSLFPKSANAIVNGAKKLLPWTKHDG